ncbi:MAG TPA: hypothetical protein DEA22_03815 [Blastocatellia bacterium]|nr:hypothetical protein [Blastocatellia bacterium]
MKQIKSIFIFAVILLSTNLAIFGQGNPTNNDTSDAKAVNIPKLTIPPGTVATGIGGEVRVKVQLDETGKVIKIDDIDGPRWVCPSKAKNDVLAIRAASSAAAQNAVFSPAIRNGRPVKSSAWITFLIPNKRQFAADSNKTTSGDATSASDNNASITKDEVKQVTGGIINGRAISFPPPEFPYGLRITAGPVVVSVKVLVSTEGHVLSAEPISGPGVFYYNARIAACKAIFSPVELMGQPIEIEGVLNYVFHR